MPEDLRQQVRGVVITKFRGDLSLLDSGLREFEDRTGVDVLGVLPYDDPGLPEEDSLALPSTDQRAVFGNNDGVDAQNTVTIGVPRLPRASNVTDLEPLADEVGVRVAYLPLAADLDGVDAVVIPGTKNTVDDLLAIEEAGLDQRLKEFEGPIVGLCGGYQMLGEQRRDRRDESHGRGVDTLGTRSPSGGDHVFGDKTGRRHYA
jgi:adenosylcobyric acid synthase